MKESININWKKDMAFQAEVDGFSIMLDTRSEDGKPGKGPRPKPLMMVALAGCTGMDVVSILKKMRVEPDDLNIRVEGDLTEEHPKHYFTMHVIYEFKGKNLPLDKLEKAVSLSVEKYCGVLASYKKAMEVSHEIVIKN